MKRNHISVGLALGTALVVLAGCSQNSPTAPKTPTPSTYAISLTASPSVAGINETIVLVASVTVGGSPAPDGTSVTFATTIGTFSNGSQQAIVATSGGSTAVSLSATAGGDGIVTASVPNKSQTVAVHFRGGSVTQAAVFSVMPNQAPAMTAGTTVVLHGQGLYAPQSVTFAVAGGTYPAQVSSVAADGSAITVATPQAPAGAATISVVLGANTTLTIPGLFVFGDNNNPVLYSVSPTTGSAAGGEIVTLTGAHFVNLTAVKFTFTDQSGQAQSLPAQIVDVTTTTGTNVAHVIAPRASVSSITTPIYVEIDLVFATGSAAYPRAFAYVPDVTTPPSIFYISPVYGSVKGNETVAIYGKNFVQPATVQIGTVNETVQSVSSDGTMVTILTQPVSGTPPTAAQDVTVTTPLGVATLPAAFTYLEGVTPQLYALTPNMGPIEGGTRVTIAGSGFQYPVQVTFTVGSTAYQAQVVNNNFNQVVCIAPNVSGGLPPNTPPPFTASVVVTNTQSGKASNSLPYTYGSNIFISGFTPQAGPAAGGTTVTITGQGFVAPVSVIWGYGGATPLPWSVLSVAGTQVIAKSAAVSAHQCNGGAAALTVTNLDSNLSATSADVFSYQGTQPRITSVVIDGNGNTVTQYAPPTSACNTPWTGHTLVINGSGFSTSGVSLTFQGANGGSVGPVVVAGGNVKPDGSQVTIYLPDLTQIANNLGSINCTPGGGGCGSQWLSTSVSLSVRNADTGCSDTLPAAMIIVPCDTSCRPTNVTSLTLSSGASGTQTVGAPFVVTANIAPAQTQATTLSLTCLGFSCPAVTIPATVTSFPFSVTPNLATPSGQIFATAGSGSCQVSSNILSYPVQAPLSVTLVINAGAAGSVTSAPAGININTATTQTFNFTTSSVVLTAAPTTGSFGGWSGDCAAAGMSLTATVTMDAAHSCTATLNFP